MFTPTLFESNYDYDEAPGIVHFVAGWLPLGFEVLNINGIQHLALYANESKFDVYLLSSLTGGELNFRGWFVRGRQVSCFLVFWFVQYKFLYVSENVLSLASYSGKNWGLFSWKDTHCHWHNVRALFWWNFVLNVEPWTYFGMWLSLNCFCALFSTKFKLESVSWANLLYQARDFHGLDLDT